ncbi:MAG: anti-sigma factor [Gemmatimonadetes bacterium]|nr:anti-sigma factor [Gemmatimonadota bacterium]
MNTPTTSHSNALREPTADELLTGELTAALFVASGAAADDGPLPDLLAARLVHTGEALVRSGAVPPRAVAPLSVAPVAPEVLAPVAPRARFQGTRAVAWGGWLAAAALLAVVLRPSATPAVDGGRDAPTPAMALADSLAGDTTATRLTFGAGADTTGLALQGSVTWDARGQRGVLRLAGLVANDRSQWQYQLWIVDADRDTRYPVDGGVFDVPAAGGELVVPVHPRVSVGKAALFVITVERPGGVVVSDRSRVAAIAQAPEAGL